MCVKNNCSAAEFQYITTALNLAYNKSKESAKLRPLLVPVPRCLACLRAYVLTCQRVLRVYVLIYVYIYIYIYIYMYLHEMYMYIQTYVHLYRERERERIRGQSRVGQKFS